MNEPVVSLRCAEHVEIDGVPGDWRFESVRRGRLRKTGVEEPGSVMCPSDGGEARPCDFVGKGVSTLDIENPDGTPVSSTFLAGKGNMPPVFAGGPFCQGRRAILGPCVRIYEDMLRAVRPFAHDENRLVVKAGIAGKEIAVSALYRGGQAGMIKERRQPLPEGFSARQPGQMCSRQFVLRLHPLRDLGVTACIAFQPPVWIGNHGAKMLFHRVGASGFGIDHFRFLCSEGMANGFSKRPDRRSAGCLLREWQRPTGRRLHGVRSDGHG